MEMLGTFSLAIGAAVIYSGYYLICFLSAVLRNNESIFV